MRANDVRALKGRAIDALEANGIWPVATDSACAILLVPRKYDAELATVLAAAGIGARSLGRDVHYTYISGAAKLAKIAALAAH